MTGGRLIAVVGPSGVGKDSVMEGIAAAMPSIKLVRRAITRSPELGGEDFDAITQDAFDAAVSEGAFCLHWGAHNLRYGIPVGVLSDVRAGASCLVNLSRSVLDEARALFPSLLVLHLSASPEVLAKRLVTRGRETEDEIRRRLSRKISALPTGLDVIELRNDGALADTVARAVAHLQPERA